MSVARLRDLGTMIRGVGYDPRHDLYARRTTETVDLLRANNVQAGRIVHDDVQHVHRRRVRSDQYLRNGDVLICAANGSKRLVGKAAQLWEPRQLTFGAFMMAYRPSPAKVVPQYVSYHFHTKAYRDWVELLLAGSSINNLRPSDLGALSIVLPPRGEQERVAAALADYDNLIHSLQRLIAKKQAMKQGMVQQLLAGTVRLPGFRRDWKISAVGVIAEVKTGPFGSSLHESDYVAKGTPIITVEHLGKYGVDGTGAPMVSDADRRRLRAYALDEGDIVFSRVGSIDRNARISTREAGWLFSGRLLRVRFNKALADSRFMSEQFHSERFKDLVRAVAVGQTMPSLNTSILRGIEISVPPVEEQHAIGQVASDLDDELQQLERRLRKVLSLKTGMMQQLLTDRTRLPVEASS